MKPHGDARDLGLMPLGAMIAKRRQSRPDQRNGHANATMEKGSGKNAALADPSSTSGSSAAGRNQARRMQHDETYQVIQSYIADFARELNDRAPLKTSTTRAYHLYQRSGLDRDAFIAQLYAARAIVKERAGSIRSVGEKDAWGAPVKQRAAYYYAVLEDLLGLRDDPADPLDRAPRGSGSSQT